MREAEAMRDNPWLALPLAPPYVLADDKAKIERHNEDSPPALRFETGALPFPFMGRPDAPVVLLHLNPGVQPGDLDEQVAPGFATRYRANLAHAPMGLPCFLLDPALRSHPGHGYWTRHLRSLIQAVGLTRAASGLLILEWFPYASPRAPRHFPRLESQRYTAALLERSLHSGALVLGLRAVARWEQEIPRLADYPNLFVLNSPQAAAVSPKNCPGGFEAAVQRLLYI